MSLLTPLNRAEELQFPILICCACFVASKKVHQKACGTWAWMDLDLSPTMIFTSVGLGESCHDLDWMEAFSGGSQIWVIYAQHCGSFFFVFKFCCTFLCMGNLI